jgi:hypothetical protein
MAYKRISPQPVFEGGTGNITLTNHGVLLGQGMSAIGATSVGTTGQVLTGVTGADPVFSAPAASSISITGNTGGALTGNAFTFTGGTTGLSFGGAVSTQTLTFAGITANGGTVSLATDATTSTINVGTGAGVKTSTFGSTNSTSATTVQSGTGALNVTSTNGALTINSGTGALGISTDAAATTMSIGTGAAVKTITIGSTNTTSSLALNFGGSTGSQLSTYITGGSWTPTVAFGGASVGVTYTTQTGYYTRIGNVVTFAINILLSNKGSSTGLMTVTGLPFTVLRQAEMACSLGTVTFVGAYVVGVAIETTTSLVLQVITSANASANLTNTAFANTSSVFISGSYLV